MLPKVLAWNPRPFATPLAAIIVLCLSCAVLLNLDFSELIVLGTFVSGASPFMLVLLLLLLMLWWWWWY
jgi:hypothetical protein